ncbi:hypothetical protein B9Z65_3503 [Elsinoe australis]|uniref:NAD(P)-binding protein n=1 Tax=Elsinoe australis TaxID=40998 RepID=A0A2P8AFD3_9PEZI|nr:hypothetical protein B9Z65_3503 [Elsinoe australis]
MLVLTTPQIATLLTTLTSSQFLTLQDKMAASLASFSSQHPPSSSDPHPEPTIHQPPRTILTTSESITSLIMPCTDTHTTTSVKTVCLAPGNPPLGAITVFSPDGTLRGVLNAAELTAFRTALVTSCVLRHVRECRRWVGPQGGANVVVFGGGRQAVWHLRLLRRTLGENVGRVTVVNRGRGRVEGWGEAGDGVEFLVKDGNEGYKARLREVLGQADVVVGTTPSTEPLFSREMLGERKGRFVALIGSYKPTMVEVDTETLMSGGKVLVDSVEDCLIESGEIIKAGLGPQELIEIGSIFSGAEKLEEESPGQNVVFK